MYLKLVKSKIDTHLKTGKSHSQNGKIHQRVISNLGRLDKLMKGRLENIVRDLSALISSDTNLASTVGKSISLVGCNTYSSLSEDRYPHLQIHK